MEYRFEFLAGPFDLVVTMAGAASVQEMILQRSELLADPRLRPGLNVLADLSAVEATSLSHDDIFALAGDASRFEAMRFRAGAIVAPRPLLYGLARMFEGYSGRTRLAEHLTVVETVEEAYRWLAELDPPPA